MSHSVASDPYTRSTDLIRLAQHPKSNIRMAVAANTSSPCAALERLAKDKDEWIRTAGARNPVTPEALLVRLASDAVKDVRRAVSVNPSTPADALWLLLNDDVEIRCNVARHCNLDDTLVSRLAEDVSEVRELVSESINESHYRYLRYTPADVCMEAGFIDYFEWDRVMMLTDLPSKKRICDGMLGSSHIEEVKFIFESRQWDAFLAILTFRDACFEIYEEAMAESRYLHHLTDFNDKCIGKGACLELTGNAMCILLTQFGWNNLLRTLVDIEEPKVAQDTLHDIAFILRYSDGHEKVNLLQKLEFSIHYGGLAEVVHEEMILRRLCIR